MGLYGMTAAMGSTSCLGRVLIIAGSDSGGGAGVQADIKTVTALGGYAATAITALTVQNTLGVSAVHEAPLDIVLDQARAVLDDIGADVIKTGMLARAETVEAVAGLIGEAGVPAVVDPVMVAKGGASLLEDRAVAAVREALATNEGFVSAQSLHNELHDGGSSIGLATVYRALADLAAEGDADSLQSPDGEALYRACSTSGTACRWCRRARPREKRSPRCCRRSASGPR